MFILERLINLIAPEHCLQCGAEGLTVCNWCRPDMIIPVPSRCFMCQKQTNEYRVCKTCRHNTPLTHVWTVTDYTDKTKQLVTSLKFGYKRHAATVIAHYMFAICPFLPPDVLICHVPTVPSRVRERGFDQALLIARAFAAHHNRPVAKALYRRGKARQVGALRIERITQMQDAFWAGRKTNLRGKTIVLVDDVVTTGATLAAAARVLKKAGARSVSAIVFARVK